MAEEVYTRLPKATHPKERKAAITVLKASGGLTGAASLQAAVQAQGKLMRSNGE